MSLVLGPSVGVSSSSLAVGVSSSSSSLSVSTSSADGSRRRYRNHLNQYNSCINNPSEDSHTLIDDLLNAMKDDEMVDITLIGNDNVNVDACKFVLAARSRVLKRMLYGNFREAKATEIQINEYNSIILKGIVDYCCNDTIDNTLSTGMLVRRKMRKKESYQQQHSTTDKDRNSTTGDYNTYYYHYDEYSVRQLMALHKAADFFELPGLQHITSLLIYDIMVRYPWLACVIYDESNPRSALEERAFHIIKCRPYVSLVPPDEEDDNNSSKDNCSSSSSGGGVECLRPERLLALMMDHNIEAGEFFLFQMLRRWVECQYHNNQEIEKSAIHEVAIRCSLYIRLHYIEPQLLLSDVKTTNLVPESRIVEAITHQALKASQDKIWFTGCRGQTSVDRVLVEGAGNKNVNGCYHRINGLSNGEIYSKHEVSCGQQYVYTLSCSSNKDDNQYIECRIFCSKVLTHNAIKILHKISTQVTTSITPPPTTPFIQPLLQVININLPYKEKQKRVSLLKNHRHVYLSDGEHYIAATLSKKVNAMVEKHKIVENSLIKLIEFDSYELNGCKTIHIASVNIIPVNPGHVLGSPTSIINDDNSNTNHPNGVNDNINSPEDSFEDSTSAEHNDNGLQQLYSCKYPMNTTKSSNRNKSSSNNINKDGSTIPRDGWEVERQGQYPSPTCTWIPASPPSSSSSSSALAVDTLIGPSSSFSHSSSSSSDSNSNSNTSNREKNIYNSYSNDYNNRSSSTNKHCKNYNLDDSATDKLTLDDLKTVDFVTNTDSKKMSQSSSALLRTTTAAAAKPSASLPDITESDESNGEGTRI